MKQSNRSMIWADAVSLWPLCGQHGNCSRLTCPIFCRLNEGRNSLKRVKQEQVSFLEKCYREVHGPGRWGPSCGISVLWTTRLWGKPWSENARICQFIPLRRVFEARIWQPWPWYWGSWMPETTPSIGPSAQISVWTQTAFNISLKLLSPMKTSCSVQARMQLFISNSCPEANNMLKEGFSLMACWSNNINTKNYNN